MIEAERGDEIAIFQTIKDNLKDGWQKSLFDFCYNHSHNDEGSYWTIQKKACNFPGRDCFGRSAVRFLKNKDKLRVWISVKKNQTIDNALIILREKIGQDLEYTVYEESSIAIHIFISNDEQSHRLIEWLKADNVTSASVGISEESKLDISSLDDAVHAYLGKKMEELYDQIEDERLKTLLEQVNKNISVYPETTLNLARKSAELICKKIYKDSLQKEIDKPIDNVVSHLEKTSSIPRLLAAHLFTILKYGNFGSHDQGEESIGITTELVAPCLLAYIWCLDWCVSVGYA
ncbi:MAG: hypothetical protein ACJ0IB_04020 [Verrucomicrobiales bacterium]